MKYIKSLIILVLMLVLNTAFGQSRGAVLDEIDFNDTTMINSDFMWKTIADYITSEQNKDANPENQVYNMILAANEVLSRSSTSYVMYSAVYQYLINGFSLMGANQVVDYMIQLPQFEKVGANDSQYEEIKSMASRFERVKIGMQAPDIHLNTIKNQEFTLSEINAKTILIFWSYSCPHCRDFIKDLGEIAKKRNDIAIVTVNVSGELKKVKRLLTKSHLGEAYNICDGMGWKSPIVDAFAVDMTPSVFLLDEDMKIIAKPFDIVELKTLIN